MAFDLDVVVDVDLGEPPGGELVARRGQGSKRRLVELLEERRRENPRAS